MHTHQVSILLDKNNKNKHLLTMTRLLQGKRLPLSKRPMKMWRFFLRRDEILFSWEPVVCPQDVHTCSDKYTASRDPKNNYEFPACPAEGIFFQIGVNQNFRLQNSGWGTRIVRALENRFWICGKLSTFRNSRVYSISYKKPAWSFFNTNSQFVFSCCVDHCR